MDRCLPFTQEVEGSTPIGGTCPNDFFRSNRPGYPHPACSELKNNGFRVAVGACSVTERRRYSVYQTGKIVHANAKHYKHNEDGRTAPGVGGHGSVPLSHSGNVVTRMEWDYNINIMQTSLAVRILMGNRRLVCFCYAVRQSLHTGYSETTNATENNKRY